MRTNTEITIKRIVEGSETTVLSHVPIVSEARRRWKLMEEDCIIVPFNLADYIKFKIGDYVEDDLGVFYITETPAPPELVEGGFRYNLQFNKDYIGWKNKILQLTYIENGEIVRRETNWSLTDKLEIHLQEVIKNLTALGYSFRYCFDGTNIYKLNSSLVFVSDGTLDTTKRFQGVDGPDTMAYIEYAAADIFTAITEGICKAYGCEFWITDDDVICLGKCIVNEANRLDVKQYPSAAGHLDWHDSSDNDILDSAGLDIQTADYIAEGINAEKIVSQKNDKPYANRLYVYGSTRNVPYSYRKNLVFTYDADKTGGFFRDSKRSLFPNMINGASDDRTVAASFIPNESIYQGSPVHTQDMSITKDIDIQEGETLIIGPYTNPDYDDSLPEQQTPVSGGSGSVSEDEEEEVTTPTYNIYYRVNGGSYVLLDGEIPISKTTTYSLEIEEQIDSIIIEVPIEHSNGDYWNISIKGISPTISIGFDGNDYDVVFNADNQRTPGWLSFVGSAPSGFVSGSQFTIDESDLNLMAIPEGYYTLPNDNGQQKFIGENRLMLPETGTHACPGGYIGEADIDSDKLVERVVMLESVYPRCAFRIYDIKQKEGTIKGDTYADGSSASYTVTQFSFKIKRITATGDVAFNFTKDMLLSSESLAITFATRDEITGRQLPVGSGSYLLSGMTFGLQYNGNGTFTIQWNEDYGTIIPNAVLCPSNGDAFFLSGWNVRALSALDIISDAEEELYTKGNQYWDAIQVDDFTHTCSMMSDWAEETGVLMMGQSARVYYGDNTKFTDSRVIGYELHLDYPYNTPVYTIGETDAYSRIKQIEKEIGASSESVSAESENIGGSAVSNATYAGASLIQMWQTLANNEELEDFDESTKIDIAHIPDIPSSKIGGGVDSFFEEDNDHTFTSGKKAIKLKDEYAGLWTPGFMAQNGVSTTPGQQTITLETVWASLRNLLTDHTYDEFAIVAAHLTAIWGMLAANSNNVIHSSHIPQATSAALGGVKVDGTSITINNGTGVISGFAGVGLDGLTAPKKIVIHTNNINPSDMDADAIYLKVSISS